MSAPTSSLSTVPEERDGPQLRVLFTVMMAVPTIAVIVRFWSRALLPSASASRRPIRFWWDDWCALAAALVNIVVCSIFLQVVNSGMDGHNDAANAAYLTNFLKFVWVSHFVYDIGTSLAKASALFFYARIFNNPNSRFRYALWTAHGLNVVWTVAIVLADILQCMPVENYWLPTRSGTCIDEKSLWLGDGVPSLITDLVILVLPLPMLWRLKLSVMRRFLIMGLFVCAYMVVIVAIVRTAIIIQSSVGPDANVTYNFYGSVPWLGTEIGISVVTISLPSMLFFVQRAYYHGTRSLFTAGTATSVSPSHDTWTIATTCSYVKPYDGNGESGPSTIERPAKMVCFGDSNKSYDTEITLSANASWLNKVDLRFQRYGIQEQNAIVISQSLEDGSRLSETPKE